jgi:RNA polymerase sigma-70 factor (ECF subfamily)
VALELTAETFALALQTARRFRDPGDGSARPWLFGIARNLVRMYQRTARVERAARRRLGILDETTRFSADESAHVDRIDAGRRGGELRRALDSLPEAQRVAIELRVVDELSYAEIAMRQGCTDVTARLRVSRGLARVRDRLRHRPTGGAV